VLARDPPTGVLPVRHFSMSSVMRLVRNAGMTAVDKHAYHWVTPDRGDLMLLLRRREGTE